MYAPLSPPPGLDSDDTTFGAEGRWADGDNVRFLGGRPRALGGSVTKHTSAAASYQDLFVMDRSGTITVFYGGQQELRAGTGFAAPSDISPSSLPVTLDGWSMDSFGTTLLANLRGKKLYEWSGSGDATEVANAPDEINCILVTPERQVLALGCNEESSGTFNPLCIRGSDLEDYSDWTTSSTNNAFEHILEGGGEILAAKMIGPYVAVWTTAGLHLGQFLGDPAQTYRFDRVDEGCGIIAPRAVAILNQIAYWLTPDLRLLRWSPGTLPTEVPCPIGQTFRANISVDSTDEAHIYLVARRNRQEIWIFYFHTGDSGSGGGPSRYIAYAISESLAAGRPVWFRGQLARWATIDSPLLASLGTKGEPLSVDVNGVVRLDDIEGSGGNPAGYIQSADQYIDNSRRRFMIRGIIPDFEQQTSDVLVTLFVRDRPMSSATTEGPFTVPQGATKKDFRASGKIVSAKISWEANNIVAFGTPVFDVVELGER